MVGLAGSEQSPPQFLRAVSLLQGGNSLFEMGCQKQPQNASRLFLLWNNGLGNVLTYWVVLINSSGKFVRHKISQMQTFWSKSLFSNIELFNLLFLPPCNTWQMTFLFLTHPSGHTQGYSQCKASEWEWHCSRDNLESNLICEEKKRVGIVQTSGLSHLLITPYNKQVSNDSSVETLSK